MKRKKMKTETIRAGRRPFEIPKGLQVDWTRTNKAIGEQLGCSLLTVMNLRKREGVEPNPRGRPIETTSVGARAYKDTLEQIKGMRDTINELLKNLSKKQTA